MNISLQVCGLIITLALLILYESHATLGLKGEQFFKNIIIATCFCLFLDALSVLAIHFRYLFPIVAVKIVCKAYLISMLWVGWGNLSYVVLDSNFTQSIQKKSIIIGKIVILAESIVVALLPIDIFEEENSIYTFGPAVIGTYIFVLITIISIMAVAIYIRRKKNSRRGMVVIMTTSLWIIAAAIQMINNALLVVGFAMAVGIMILYVVLENPDSNLDRQLGCFNSHAMQHYLAMYLESKSSLHVMDLSLTDVKAVETHGIDVTAATRNVIEKIEALHDIKVFKNLNTGLVIVSSDADKLDKVAQKAMEIVSIYPGASNVVTISVVRNAGQFHDVDELLKFLTFIRGQSSARLSAIVNVSDDMIKQFNKAKAIEEEIDLALAEDRVEVFLQPICDAEGKPKYAEALVRIRQKDGKMLSPGLFIPVSESTGQVKALGERVLEKVCSFLRDSDVLSQGIAKIDVNLSAVQCDDSAMAGRLCQIAENYGISPNYISFEITETAVSEVKDALIENMNVLVSKGFSFALDDFGKGESNLMYIVEMPGQIIKLDIDMVKAYFSNPKAQPVVESIVTMAKRLNLTTIAEGVETEEELAGITKLGIDYIQGYYFSKPLPMSEFTDYVRKNGYSTEKIQTPLAEQYDEEYESADYTIDEVWLANHRILLVEDNEMNREIAQEILEDLGFSVEAVEDGAYAVDKVCNSQPGDYGIVLMDIRMPIMDGYEATRRIRNLNSKDLASIPIIALTAQDTAEDHKASFEAGMDGHLCKPLDGKKLKKMVAEILNKT